MLMRNCSAICAEMVVEMVWFGAVQGDAAGAAKSGIIVALVKLLDQNLLNRIPNS